MPNRDWSSSLSSVSTVASFPWRPRGNDAISTAAVHVHIQLELQGCIHSLGQEERAINGDNVDNLAGDNILMNCRNVSPGWSLTNAQ